MPFVKVEEDDNLVFLVNHVTLPPQLPDSQDNKSLHKSLLDFVCAQAESYRNLSPHKTEWAKIVDMLSIWKKAAQTYGGYSRKILETALKNLAPGDFFALHIRAQNAGLMIRVVGKQAIFASFEAMPKPEAVVESTGRLACKFPSRAVSIPLNLLSDAKFVSQFVSTIIDLDIESTATFRNQHLQIVSAGIQDLDAADPKLVSSMLMAILAAYGQPVDPQPITKNIRDELNGSGADLPWRRSSLWVVVKVVVQLALSQSHQAGPHSEYKNFMLFLLARLNEMVTNGKCYSSLLYHVNAKLARRFEKLKKLANLHDFVRDTVLSSMRLNHEVLSTRWISIQQQNEKPLSMVELVSSPEATRLKLLNSRHHLTKVLHRDEKLVALPNKALKPSHRLQFQPWPDWNQPMPDDSSLQTQDVGVVLMDFEDWVEHNIQSVPSSENACIHLANLNRYYMSVAMREYSNLPERFSIMTLTVLETWVRVDQMATEILPLMRDYPPEIPTTFPEPLLLPKLFQLQRLRKIETYLTTRRNRASKEFPSHFSEPSSFSFAVVFYNSSIRHKQLREHIEKKAKKSREEKKAEHKTLTANYMSLKEQADGAMHTNHLGKGSRINCKGCQLDKEAKRVKIEAHEWPLPGGDHDLATIIFEVDCPPVYRAWRDFTWAILQDIGRKWAETEASGGFHKSCQTQLNNYGPLREFTREQRQRVILASRHPEHIGYHSLPVELSDILLGHGPTFRLYDSASQILVADQKLDPTLEPICHTMLPPGPYEKLQYAVNGTKHFQNQVIAQHGQCPAALSLHEYDSYGSLRAGERIQWLNILLVLTNSDLTLNTEAACTLITQAAWQAGSAKKKDDYRTSHGFLKDRTFVNSVLDRTSAIAAGIEANWKEEHSMTILIALLTRLISFGPTRESKQRALDQLYKLRQITIQWTRDTAAKLSEQLEPENAVAMQHRALCSSTLCRMTFDIEEDLLLEVLNSKDDFATLIECTASICDHTPADWRSVLNGHLLRRVERDRNLAHRLAPFSRGRALSHYEFMDEGIARIWPEYSRGDSAWSQSLDEHQPWIRTMTRATSTRKSQTVDFNCLDGQFLVDGSPVGRLPKEYTEHKEYRRIFGEQVLHVITANVAPMVYMTAKDFHGYQIFFARESESSSLVIRAHKNNTTYELVPHDHFSNDIPTLLIDDYVHWMNLNLSEVEFRPLKSRFQSSVDNPRLFYSASESTFNYLGKWLVDFKSTLGVKLCKILKAIEERGYLHMTISEANQIEVLLPRLNLSFFVNGDGELESLDLSAVIDQNQRTGTFIGLKNQLVVCQKSTSHEIQDRSVLVILGEALATSDDDHVKVRIQPGNTRKVQYFRYRIDPILKRLRAPRNIPARLFQAHLHALTSYALPDPLTGRTGTEESLYCLQQPAIRGLLPVDSDCLQILGNISHLTPRREYSSKSSTKKRMQVTIWDPELPPLSQHDEFLPLVNSIIEGSNTLALIQCEGEPATVHPIFERGNPDLLNKAAARNATFRNHDTGGSLHSEDTSYTASDAATEWDPHSLQAYEMAYLIQNKLTSLGVRIDSENVEERFENFTSDGDGRTLNLSLANVFKLNIIKDWKILYNFCRSASLNTDKFRIQFLLSILAFIQSQRNGSHKDSNLLKILLAICVSGRLVSEILPPVRKFKLAEVISPPRSIIEQIVRRNCSTSRPKEVGAREKWKLDLQQQTKTLVDHLLSQWPCSKPTANSGPAWDMINVAQVVSLSAVQFDQWYDNSLFLQHLNRVKVVVKDFQDAPGIPFLQYIPNNSPVTRNRSTVAPVTYELFTGAPSDAPEIKALTISNGVEKQYKFDPAHRDELISISARFSQGVDSIERAYGQDMTSSLDALSMHLEEISPQHLPMSISQILAHRVDCLDHANSMFSDIQSACGVNSADTEHLRLGGLMSHIPPVSVLGLVSTAADLEMNEIWRRRIVDYGKALTMIQRAERMAWSAGKGDIASFYREARNIGHQNWDAYEWTDWLLMEIEGNSLIRPVQIEVAREMLAPTGDNSVMQLNMGEGKSSWIMPLVATALADGKNLARVIVLKPLLKAMAAVLTERLGGLLNRKVYFTPFSRRTKLDAATQKKLFGIWEECRKSRGILLAQPEHIHSFRLIGLEKLSTGEKAIALPLLECQATLQKWARNIIDESDEIMDPKEQLIYSIGPQQPFDGGVDRWQTSQRMLSQIIRHIDMPDRTQCRHDGCFPAFHMDSEELDDVLSSVVDDISHSSFPGINLENHGHKARQVVLRFIKKREHSVGDLDLICKIFQGPELERILVLRGLLAFGIMSHCLSRRWSVDYGLTNDRMPKCLVAVPYRAKGCPSRAAEFGHPEVMILLTCLSYYYSGLTEEQLATCFALLMISTDPTLEYSTWSERCDCMPDKFRNLYGVNLDDNGQCRSELFPHLKYNKATIDFFLASAVFPAYCKEFPQKLSSCSWDIPGDVKSGCPPTTGFSGTNDSRYLLPLSITQRDLQGLVHTNAMVMSHLIRESNRQYICAKTSEGKRLCEEGLLTLISKQTPRLCVIVDVGAYFIGLGNREVAQAWLSMDSNADAAVYFDENDEVMVNSRDGRTEVLASSKFQDNLDRCLVYLDQSHTRGVDLRFSKTARAALMIGPGLTKDRLVQGCMRMRKLNEGQSVLFFAPPEIDKDIRRVAKKDFDETLDSRDVLEWCLEQTMESLRRNRPLWVVQGLNHSARRLAEQQFMSNGLSNALNSSERLQDYLGVLEEKDAETLKGMYAKSESSILRQYSKFSSDAIITKLIQVGTEIGKNRLKISDIDEEQEKEVSHEKEQEMQLERPLEQSPMKHTLHAKLRRFVETGDLAHLCDMNEFIEALELFRRTSAAKYLPEKSTKTAKLLMTRDFSTTVHAGPGENMDDYLRPVNFILSKTHGNDRTVLVVISPYEANELLDQILVSKEVSLHLYAAKVSHTMPFVDDLSFYSTSAQPMAKIPIELRRELNFFAGQLYFRTAEEYKVLKSYLEVPAVKDEHRPGKSTGNKKETEIDPKRLALLQNVVAILRKGRDASRTHVGRILEGEKLEDDTFDG